MEYLTRHGMLMNAMNVKSWFKAFSDFQLGLLQAFGAFIGGLS